MVANRNVCYKNILPFRYGENKHGKAKRVPGKKETYDFPIPYSLSQLRKAFFIRIEKFNFDEFVNFLLSNVALS